MTLRRSHITPLAVIAMLAGAILIGLAVASGPVRGATHAVSVVDDSFSPGNLTVSVGDTVTWTNNGGNAHTVTSNAGAPAAFQSGTLNPGQTFSFTFTAAGTYGYRCEYHSNAAGTSGMVGTVTVQAAAAAPASPSAAASAAPNTATSVSGPAGSLVGLFGSLLLIAGGLRLAAEARARLG